jgi:ATP-dependent RNA helicase RhlE
MKFESLALCEPILRNLQAAGYREATPIQQKAIPKLLAGRDLIGCAQTGTGKTAAFALPTLQRLITSAVPPSGAARRRQRSGRRAIRALILTPTRELAAQIGESLAVYSKNIAIRHTVVFGGVRQGPQVQAVKAGIDVLVATPGRLLDLIQQGVIDLSNVEVLILDEADRMLDMGFIHDLRKIVSRVPERRQTLMFSATMPKQIRDLARQWLRRPLEVKVAPEGTTPDRVAQAVCYVDRRNKTRTLVDFLNAGQRSRTLVFSRTKHGADRLVRCLRRDGIRAISIHGNKSQSQRTAAVRDFNAQQPPVLVATDLAARGLDFSEVSHVINYDLPDVPETYVHRIGRTARAGATGNAISLCDFGERSQLRMIEQLTGKPFSVVQPTELLGLH